MRVARIPIAIAGSLLVTVMLVMLAPVSEAKTSVSYPGGCAIVLSKVTAIPGDHLTVSATGFPVGAKVMFQMRSVKPPVRTTKLGTVTAVANSQGTGTATLVFTLPANTAPGMYVISAHGAPPGQCDPFVSTNLMVSANVVNTTVASGGTLPRTGTDSALLFQIALILIALGGLVTLTARKRLAHARVES
jgi:LPXTG-motif cell wall-anchored protein